MNQTFEVDFQVPNPLLDAMSFLPVPGIPFPKNLEPFDDFPGPAGTSVHPTPFYVSPLRPFVPALRDMLVTARLGSEPCKQNRAESGVSLPMPKVPGSRSCLCQWLPFINMFRFDSRNVGPSSRRLGFRKGILPWRK